MTSPEIKAGSTLTVIRGARNLASGAWTETSRHDVTPVGVDPTGTSETTATGDQVTADVTVYAAFDADVQATDRVLIDGNTAELFDVQGDPQRWKNPRTGLSVGCVIQLVHHRG